MKDDFLSSLMVQYNDKKFLSISLINSGVSLNREIISIIFTEYKKVLKFNNTSLHLLYRN
jgi:hypothetical protein